MGCAVNSATPPSLSSASSNSSDRIHDGARLVNSAGRSLAEIVESIKKVATIVSGIATASSQQAASLEQINRALTQLDDMTGAPNENPGDAIAA